jgi:hypothetical protein
MKKLEKRVEETKIKAAKEFLERYPFGLLDLKATLQSLALKSVQLPNENYILASKSMKYIVSKDGTILTLEYYS